MISTSFVTQIDPKLLKSSARDSMEGYNLGSNAASRNVIKLIDWIVLQGTQSTEWSNSTRLDLPRVHRYKIEYPIHHDGQDDRICIIEQ